MSIKSTLKLHKKIALNTTLLSFVIFGILVESFVSISL